MWIAAATSWLLSFSVSVWMESQRGHYRINQVLEFIAVSVVMVLGTYVIFRLGHYPLIHRTLAALYDLEAQVTEQTQRAQKQRKYWIAAMLVLVILLTVSVVWGVTAWLAATR